MILGYKVFLKGLENSFSEPFELNKEYTLSGNAKWSMNGYHFCLRPEDTLRNFDSFNYELEIALVEGSGSIVEYNDEYYGYYDMYASTKIKVLKVLTREEIIKDVLSSNNIFRIQRLVQRFKLTEEEIPLFRGIAPQIDNDIEYYQLGNKDVYHRQLKNQAQA